MSRNLNSKFNANGSLDLILNNVYVGSWFCNFGSATYGSLTNNNELSFFQMASVAMTVSGATYLTKTNFERKYNDFSILPIAISSVFGGAFAYSQLKLGKILGDSLANNYYFNEMLMILN